MDKARSDELFAKLLPPIIIAFFIGVAIYEANTGLDTSALFMKVIGFLLYGSVILGVGFFVVVAFINIIGRIFR